jgi:carbonic anhydrase
METPTINISSQNIYGNCDLKCSYNFKYNKSNLTAKNNGVFISYSHELGSTNPVVYNTQKYNVSKINIYSPSIHKFNNKYVNAEIVIEHIPEIGGEMLYVCIPIIASSNTSDASYMVSEMIQNVANNAPAINETTALNISQFNLNTIVPVKPFFSYTGTEGLVGQVIIFGNNNAIPISQTVLNVLSKIIKPFPITIRGGNVFYNTKGPNTVKIGGDGIYISCQPTGSSQEEKTVTYDKVVKYDLFNFNLLNNPSSSIILQIIIGFIICISVFLLLNYGYVYFTSDAPATGSSSKLFGSISKT